MGFVICTVKHVNMEIARLQIIVLVKLVGRDQFVMPAYPCQVANMETVQMLWSVIVWTDGQGDIATFHSAVIVTMESVKVLKNVFAFLDGKVTLVIDVSHSQDAQ